MYRQKLFSKAFGETKKFWTIHRNWTVIAAPLGAAAYKILTDGLPKAKADFATIGWTAFTVFLISWVGTFLINVVRSPGLLDKERNDSEASDKQTTSELRQALERERFNLTDSRSSFLGSIRNSSFGILAK